MNNKLDQVPDEFKQLAEDFGKNGFITTSLENLVNWSRSGSLHWMRKFSKLVKIWIFALDDFWSCLLCGRNDANSHAKI